MKKNPTFHLLVFLEQKFLPDVDVLFDSGVHFVLEAIQLVSVGVKLSQQTLD